MEETRNIIGQERLTSIFGYWPSFHDAEIIEIALTRASSKFSGPTLTAKIHVFEITNEVLPSGYYLCHKHSIVTLNFYEVTQLYLSDFNRQNVLYGLVITDISTDQMERLKFQVKFDSSFGCDCSFSCYAIEVIDIESGIPEASIYNRTAPRVELPGNF